ncbi:MAG: molecular chaperone DnaJ [Patescibacteria group bacterium]
MSQKDYYNILGIDKNADQEEIKKAFKKLAHKYHPDKKDGDEAKFKEINEAYNVLGDEKKKKQYDQFGADFNQQQQAGQNGGQGFGGFGGFNGAGGMHFDMDDLGDIFGDFGDIFGFGGKKRSSRGGRARGADIEAVLDVEFEEAVFGAEKEVKLKKKEMCEKCKGNGAEPGTKIETCPTCKGTGRVYQVQRTIFGQMKVQTPCPDCGGEGKKYAQKCSQCGGKGVYEKDTSLKINIPAGINTGETIRFTGYGQAGEKGGPAGDLYIKVRVKPHSEFKREGYDIYSEKEIGVTQAVLGDKVDIETVYGKVKLKIPEGTQSGTVFKLKGKGVPHLNGRGKGDHLVTVKVKTPTGLSKDKKEKLKQLNI